MNHIYQGQCPDEIEGPDVRDSSCEACRALTSNQEHWLALRLPTPWIDDEAGRTNYLLLCFGQMDEVNAEALALLADEGAALGLVEGIKRHEFLLTEARDQRDIAQKRAQAVEGELEDFRKRHLGNGCGK